MDAGDPVDPVTLDPPTGLTGALGPGGFVALSWAPSPGASRYHVWRRTDADAGYEEVADSESTTALDDPSALATYHYAVTAATKDRLSGYSNEVEVVVPAAGAELTWPNADSQTNGDPWLRQHHDEVAELRPRVLVLLANNLDTPANVEAFATQAMAAFAEGSRYHGYQDPDATPQLVYELDKVADMRDDSVNDWPDDWPTVGAGESLTFVYEGLFSQEFAAHYGYPDPDDPSRFLGLCDLFERGIVNELWVAAPRYSGNPLGVYESKARVQVYDERMDATGVFDSCAANGCFEPGVAGLCKVSVRLMELATDRGTGCATHATGHGMEGLRRAIPYYSVNSARFFNFDLIARHGLPMDSQYDQCDYGTAACWAYPDDHTLAKSPEGGATVGDFSFDEWGDGCGNVHFPPNAAQQYDYTGAVPVLSTCESYGQGNGPAGGDLQSPYSSDLVADYETLYGDCGGGWQIYMRQSIPGHGNGGTGEDGLPMKSWWPFLYY